MLKGQRNMLENPALLSVTFELSEEIKSTVKSTGA